MTCDLLEVNGGVDRNALGSNVLHLGSPRIGKPHDASHDVVLYGRNAIQDGYDIGVIEQVDFLSDDNPPNSAHSRCWNIRWFVQRQCSPRTQSGLPGAGGNSPQGNGYRRDYASAMRLIAYRPTQDSGLTPRSYSRQRAPLQYTTNNPSVPL